RQLEDLAEQELHHVRLAAPSRPDEQVVRLARQLATTRPIEVDALDPPHVAVCHQAQGAARVRLAAVAQVVELLEHRPRRLARNAAYELDEVLEAGFAKLTVPFHVVHRRAARERYHEVGLGNTWGCRIGALPQTGRWM